MSDVVIENPIINSPFAEPTRHFRFSDEGITGEIVEGRRVSAYFVPIARPRKYSAIQLQLPETEWTQDRLQENAFINKVRQRVALWRQGGYAGITRTTRHLLEYWTRADRERRLFFCQIEALETAIYIAEVANHYGDAWIDSDIRRVNDEANPGLYRVAAKMATGSGKTVVMAMLIAWQALNKFAAPQDARFSDAFLVVTPGITIRDRLRVLQPNDPQNYYREHDLVPPELRESLERATIMIVNFHAFKRRETLNASKNTKELLAQGRDDAFTETPEQMVRRVCRELRGKKNIVVLNDEAHHCYRHRPEPAPEVVNERLAGDERVEAQQREEYARIWISGLEAIKKKHGIRVIYDLSATPFFLRGSGYAEGTLFPWVVSDFSLIDAIESGVVKVPRVPIADDSRGAAAQDGPTYRNIWAHIREDLPRKGRTAESVEGEPVLPAQLEGALNSLYGNYTRAYQRWEQNAAAHTSGLTPPVFIVVCANTNISRLVYNYIAGWEKTLTNEDTVAVPGNLTLFSNVVDGEWTPRPNTILVDSAQLESGEAMSADFKKVAAREIDEFKNEYRLRYPDRDANDLTDEDLLREVMNTVGKAGKLGEQVKCVVSVSMLTEGWDTNTVTHILGVRAFGTQLLCEQVVGRGLRRMSYAANDAGMFEAEYAEVYGVPFSFIPSPGTGKDPRLGPTPTRVRAIESRAGCELTFPRLLGYLYELPAERMSASFTEESKLTLTSKDVPGTTEVAAIIGESEAHYLGFQSRRLQEVAYTLAKHTLDRYFSGNDQAWRFPQILQITRDWLDECLDWEAPAYPQMLLLAEFKDRACGRIYRSIVSATSGSEALRPMLRPYDTLGSTRHVDFTTIKPTFVTREDRCPVSHVVCDSGWEEDVAKALEDIPEVLRYVKNQGLGFTIPYTVNYQERNYYPDFLVHLDDGHGPDDPLQVILEVTGAKLEDKTVKVDTARSLWVPAVNNHGGFGRWAYVEVTDPGMAAYQVRSLVHANVLAKGL